MSSPRISLIVALARNDVIGNENALPWRLPDDLKRFKALTLGKPVLMGRRTYDSIGRALPGRLNLVLTRNPEWQAPGVTVVRSLDEALERSAGAPELAVIGGADVFRLALPRASCIHLTRVHADVPGDTCFPPFDLQEWEEIESSFHPADERHTYAMTFSTLQRIGERRAQTSA